MIYKKNKLELIEAFAGLALASPAVIMTGNSDPEAVAIAALAIGKHLAEKFLAEVDANTSPDSAYAPVLELNDNELNDIEKELVLDGSLIQAIKSYRMRTGTGLYDAKMACQTFKVQEESYCKDIGGKDFAPLDKNERKLLFAPEYAKPDLKQKIEAIKAYKVRTGAMLKEAKDVIEAYCAQKYGAHQSKYLESSL